MDRERVKERLSDYLEGELTPEEKAEIDAELDRDPALQAELEELRRTLELLGRLPAVEVPDDFLQQVRQKIRRQRKSPFDIAFGLDRKIPFEAISMVLIGILLTLYLLLVVLPRERTDDLVSDPTKSIQTDAGVKDARPPMPAHRARRDVE